MAKVALHTSMGLVVIELDEETTPLTTQNFLAYVNEGFYNDTLFHRTIKNFMIQGGGFVAGMDQKSTNPSIKNEASTKLKNTIGTIAMARTNDPHSASSQFFINVADNTFLDFKQETIEGFGYRVFGKVVEGLDIVKKISEVKTTSRKGHGDVPIDEIKILEANQL